jgi:DNA topoisomerase VI subunit B
MIAHINMIGLFDDTKKNEFIEYMRLNNNIPFMYTKKKDIIEIVQQSVDNSTYDESKIIGVMICIEYKVNEFKC